ncbi:glycoside hydrolase family 125 protein [Cohnella hongkongensis]|uniref:Glycoside hydrolase family 125 protein n=1 Tax=Cohnella hongkongensis TaxID=178337 RepID=A0ABV9FF53_9BACL
MNEEPNGCHRDAADVTDVPVPPPQVRERNFELDSLCFFVRLVYAYWRNDEGTKRRSMTN